MDELEQGSAAQCTSAAYDSELCWRGTGNRSQDIELHSTFKNGEFIGVSIKTIRKDNGRTYFLNIGIVDAVGLGNALVQAVDCGLFPTSTGDDT